ncbi:MAG TPA: histidine kinase, partial [Rhodanobacter sp.]|nr:histidine kinase [Rhodanobacter sp.]
RWPLARPHLLRRALIHLLFSVLFCVAWATLGQMLRLVLMLIFEPARVTAGGEFWREFALQWLSWIFITLPFGVAVYLCVVGVEHAVRYFVEVREREVQLARLSEQLAGARFAALQAQVNPHFLFNTLNTIAVLVRDNDREGAVRIVEHLSEMLRRTLSRHRENQVTLGEELELVRQYVAIEQARFSDRLRPEFHVADSLLSAVVPSFALQHLVENAIRHGIAPRLVPGRVALAVTRDGGVLRLSLRNDGVPATPDAVDGEARPAAVGLRNVRERLARLYGEAQRFDFALTVDGGCTVDIALPCRTLAMAESA